MLGKPSEEKVEKTGYAEAVEVQSRQEPSVVLDAKAEKRLYRKMDLRLLPILSLLYLVAFLDRGVRESAPDKHSRCPFPTNSDWHALSPT